MDRYILTLILLILIACGTLYIVTRQKNTLESFSHSCLRGCKPATAITGNCNILPQPNGKNIYSCPQECHSLNLSGRQDTCTYDTDCKYCGQTTMYANGGNNNPNTPPTGPPFGPPPPRKHRPSYPPVRPPYGPPGSVPGGKMVPSLPASRFSPKKMNKNASLCPASTIVIFNS